MLLCQEFFKYPAFKNKIEKLKLNEKPPFYFEVNTYRVYKCPKTAICNDNRCLNYHNKMQKRRDPLLFKIYYNKACKYALIDKEWKDSKSLCPYVCIYNYLGKIL